MRCRKCPREGRLGTRALDGTCLTARGCPHTGREVSISSLPAAAGWVYPDLVSGRGPQLSAPKRRNLRRVLRRLRPVYVRQPGQA
jgi:hypothetical protein